MMILEICGGLCLCGVFYALVTISTSVAFRLMGDRWGRWISDVLGAASAILIALFAFGMAFTFGWLMGMFL